MAAIAAPISVSPGVATLAASEAMLTIHRVHRVDLNEVQVGGGHSVAHRFASGDAAASIPPEQRDASSQRSEMDRGLQTNAGRPTEKDDPAIRYRFYAHGVVSAP
jgi:hypothetical protein